MKFNVTEVEFDLTIGMIGTGKVNLHLMRRLKFVTLHLVYGKQTMKMTLLKR